MSHTAGQMDGDVAPPSTLQIDCLSVPPLSPSLASGCLSAPPLSPSLASGRLSAPPPSPSPTSDGLSAQPPSPSLASPLSPDDVQKLLAKLEEQNRLLETDSKSLYGGLRSPSASPQVFHFEEDSWTLWGGVVKEWEDWSKRRVGQLKELVRTGIPHHFRAMVWQLLCNGQNAAVREHYGELLTMTSPCERLIRRDITRTFPEHELFKGQDSPGCEGLFNVMKAYSLVDREVGYCQGSAFIVGLLLMQMPEEEAFCVFVKLMQDYRLRELFKPSMAELGLCIYQFEGMILEQLPELQAHFHTHGLRTSMYASSWFLTIFLSSFPLAVSSRIFDIFMCEGLEIVFRVGLAILQMHQEQLMQFDMEGMVQHIQKAVPQQLAASPDRMILTAYQVKYNPKKMKKLEKDYTAMKGKQMEEQAEMKRLRSENRLLRQRIGTLEKMYSEELVVQMEQELVQARLNEAESKCALKEMQTKILLMEKESTDLPDENNVVHLQEQLINGRLREADSLTRLKELRHRIRDLEGQWQKQQVRTVGQWRGGRTGNARSELQDELMTVRLRETHTQALLRESRHRLLQLETQSQISGSQLRRAEQVCSQREQLLTARSRDLHEQLQQTQQEQVQGVREQNKEEEMVQEGEANNMATIAELQRQITELQSQIQRLKGQKGPLSQPAFDDIHITSQNIEV